MALFDFLKNKKAAEKSKKPVENPSARFARSGPAGKSEKESEVTVAPKRVGIGKARPFSYDVVKDPHISEKGTFLSAQNKYVFKVYGNTNKPEIKKSVEGIYGVDVIKVHIVNIPPKKRRLGKTEGFKKGYKKAMVTLKVGQKIEIF